MPPERQIRVFISSTFRDMGPERDHLVKFVFPELRRLCESRGVTWGEVDLRWGVTDEEAAEGQALPICLEEIKRCRPYFIGLLGERYGWIPQAVPEDLIEREPWLQEQFGRKSVTELEIIHGVLREEAMHGHAYFYFRDPRSIESVPADQRQDFMAADAESAEKLKRLKQAIRNARDEQVCRLREDYPNPEGLGAWIREDFTRLIDELFPEGSQPDPLDREAMDHEAYAQSRARAYIGRQAYFDVLDRHAAAGGSQPLVILGESGSGKSALLANWAARHRQAQPDVLVIEHYIGATAYGADWAAMLRRIMGEFKRHLGLEQDIPEAPDALRSAFPNWLHLAAAKGRVILVLDALNQLEDRDGAPDLVWLPPVLPENVRLIVSTLPGRALEEIHRRGWPVLNVEPLELEERRQLIGAFLRDYSRKLSPARVERIAAAPPSANPLYLRVLLNELRLFGKHEELEERIAYYLEAGNPHDLYRKVIARWEQDYAGDSRVVGDTLTLLGAARRGLTEAELLLALGTGEEPLPRARWSPLYLAMSDALVSRSGLLNFAHDFLRAAARDTYLPAEAQQQQAHLRLADYFARQPAGPRQLDELPWQLVQAKAWPHLYALLSDLVFYSALAQASEFDAKACWARLEENGYRMVEAYRPSLESPRGVDARDALWISRLLMDAGHPDESLALRAGLADHFRQTGDRANLQILLTSQALILKARGDLDGAMEMLREAEEICRELGNKNSLGISLGNQALILQARGDLDGALALHRQEEAICRELGSKDGLQRTYGNQGNILFRRGDLDAALALYKQEDQICRELGDQKDLAFSLGHQANVLSARGDLDGAMALHKQEEAIYRELGNQDGLLRTLLNQANIMDTHGNPDGALALYRQVEEGYRKLGNKEGLAAALSNEGNILYGRGDLDGAMALYLQDEQICRELGSKDGLQRSLGNQAAVRQTRGDLDGAMALNRQKEQICRELGNKSDLSSVLGNQGMILKARGDLEGARALYQQAGQLCRELGNKEGWQKNVFRQADILFNRGDLDPALALYRQAEQICRERGDQDGLQRTFGGQAAILSNAGAIDAAMALLKKREQLCRELGNKDGLWESLSNQGIIISALGDQAAAMAIHRETEQIAREANLIDRLASSWGNEAVVLARLGRPEGLQLVAQAYRLANDHGLTSVVRELQALGNWVRSKLAG